MKTPLFLFSVLLFLSGKFTYAQTINKNYIDGEVYIKLKQIPQNTPTLANGGVNIAAELPFLLNANGISNVLEARRSFYFSNSSDLQRVYRVKIAKPKQIEQYMASIRKDASIEYVEPIPLHKTTDTPNDANVGNQQYLSKIKAFEAWDVSKGNTDIIVAVIDDAIQTNHEDLAANMIAGRDVSDNDNDPNPPNTNFSHGTHVAGIIGAVSNNQIGIASMGFNHIKIMPIKATPDNGSQENIYNGFEGIAWAVEHGAKIINTSWGSNSYSVTEQTVINNAYAAGVLIIAAAGNEGKNAPYYPASYNHVISVGSVTSTDEKSFFSNYDTSIDLSAPGSNILSTIPYNAYASSSGTSMAAPLVSSLFAYIWSVKNDLTQIQLENLIKNTSDNIDTQNPTYVGLIGSGRVNALKAVSCLQNNISPAISPSTPSVICTNSAVQLNCTSIEGATYQWKKNGVNIGDNLPTLNASATGQYSVVVSKGNCAIMAAPVNVSVIPASITIAVTDTIACNGDSILLQAPLLSGVNYQWKKEGINTGTNTYQFYARQNGNYTVELSGGNCQNSSSTVRLSFVTLNPVITANSNTLLCQGQNVTLGSTNTSSATYQWRKNNELIANATTLSLTTSDGGNYTIEHKLGQCVAKSNSIAVTITTLRAPAPTVTNRTICEGQKLNAANSLQAVATTCTGTLTKNYSYTGNTIGYDGDVQTGDNPSVNITDLGTYVVNKVKVSIHFEKKDQISAYTCDSPHAGSFPYTDEISFKLKSPNGTIITLLANNTYNYYAYNGPITLNFEDGLPAIVPESAPVSGSFSPQEALGTFNGQTANGVWTLLPKDNSEGDPLCVSAFSIEISVANVIFANTLSWWSAQSGGTQLNSGNEYIARDSLVGTHTYYVQNECTGTCNSERVAVNLNIQTASIAKPTIIAYQINTELANTIKDNLPTATLIMQENTRLNYGNQSTVISDRAPLIDPITICNGNIILLLGMGCDGVLQWSNNKTGTGIIETPVVTNTYTVRCKEQLSGCLSPVSDSRNIHIAPSEISVNNSIPEKGSQTFIADKIITSSNVNVASKTQLKASKSILFLPGFSSDQNSTFTAKIENICSNE